MGEKVKPRKPLPRGKPPRRKKPLPKNRKPISRSGKRLVRQALRPSRTRILAKGKSRFKRGRDKAYLEWIRGLPCALLDKTNADFIRHVCDGPKAAAHVKSRGAGGGDYANAIPLCHRAHTEQHVYGIRTWAGYWFGENGLIELRRIAAEVYPRQWEAQKALGFPE